MHASSMRKHSSTRRAFFTELQLIVVTRVATTVTFVPTTTVVVVSVVADAITGPGSLGALRLVLRVQTQAIVTILVMVFLA